MRGVIIFLATLMLGGAVGQETGFGVYITSANLRANIAMDILMDY